MIVLVNKLKIEKYQESRHFSDGKFAFVQPEEDLSVDQLSNNQK